jgi:hypothetical protein
MRIKTNKCSKRDNRFEISLGTNGGRNENNSRTNGT